jgi:hypothetical protein
MRTGNVLNRIRKDLDNFARLTLSGDQEGRAVVHSVSFGGKVVASILIVSGDKHDLLCKFLERNVPGIELSDPIQ